MHGKQSRGWCAPGLVLGLCLLAAAPRAAADDAHLDYAVDVDGALYGLDLEALTTVPLGRVRAGTDAPILGDVVSTPDGYLYGISGTTVYLINLSDPTQSTRIGDHGLDNPYGVGLGPDGQAYAMTADGRLFTIDLTTGRSREVGPLGGGFVASGDLAVMDEVVYASVKDPAGREQLVVVDAATGRVRHVAPFTDAASGAPVSHVFGLLGRKGALFGLTSGGLIVRVDPETGRCTTLARTGISWWGATEYLRL